ncbi:MAG: winged helix DNA-binding protein [Candidatus Altiarchaeota archaeon]
MEEKIKEGKSIINLILYEKPVAVILSLRSSEKYASKVSKEVDCTYTHTLKILSELKSYGIVEFKKEGRIKKVKLTESGQEIANNLNRLINVIKKFEGKKLKKKK